jgi:hypothetical protein
MRTLRHTYVHRGDALRRRKRVKQTIFLAGSAIALTIVITVRKPHLALAEAAVEAGRPGLPFGLGDTQVLREELETAKGERDLVKGQYERASRILGFSTRFRIPGDLAQNIFDGALAEGIDPELAFRLVQLESDFKEHATSSVGAVGLTQVMVPTAKYFEKGITRDRLYDRKTNLKVGFRYLRTLIGEYHGNANMALLVYNRGEVAVRKSVAAGINPSNGYDRHLMKGYKGNGVVD